MHYRTVLALTILSVLLMTAEAIPMQSAPSKLLSLINLEEPCVKQGGVCRLIHECDENNLVQMKGVLCPKQSHLGVECCYT